MFTWNYYNIQLYSNKIKSFYRKAKKEKNYAEYFLKKPPPIPGICVGEYSFSVFLLGNALSLLEMTGLLEPRIDERKFYGDLASGMMYLKILFNPFIGMVLLLLAPSQILLC